MDIVRDGEREATNYFFSIGDETECVDRRCIEPSEGEWRGGLDYPEDESPHSRRTHRLLCCSERIIGLHAGSTVIAETGLQRVAFCGSATGVSRNGGKATASGVRFGCCLEVTEPGHERGVE